MWEAIVQMVLSCLLTINYTFSLQGGYQNYYSHHFLLSKLKRYKIKQLSKQKKPHKIEVQQKIDPLTYQHLH